MSTVKLAPEFVAAWRQEIIRRGRAGRDFRAIIKRNDASLKALWSAYNTERNSLGRLPLSAERMVLPYLMGFHLNNFARAAMVLQRALERETIVADAVANLKTARVIDVGSGSGAASQAAVAWLQAMGIRPDGLEIELMDRSRHLVDAGISIFQDALGMGTRVRALKQPLESPQSQQILSKVADREFTGLSVFTLGYVWNEIERNRPAKMHLLEVFRKLSKSGPAILLVLEPAAEGPARSALQLREELQQHLWHPLYPCPRVASCPLAVGRNKDYCYSELEAAMPQEQRMIDQSLRLKRSLLGVSGYLFANARAVASGAAQQPNLSQRVLIGEPLVQGKTQWLVCGSSGIEKQPPKNAAGIVRGDVL